MNTAIRAVSDQPQDDLFAHRFLRLSDVLKIIPVGQTTWWKGVKDGRYPPAVRLSERTVAWRASDIVALSANLSSGSR